jgi:hypothetical protein
MLSLALAVSLAAAPNLVGTWSGSGFTIVLEAGGAGTISDGPMVPPEPVKWKVSGSNLMLTQDGDTIPYAMQLAGDTLTLSSVVLDAPITLKRGAAGKGAPAAAPAPVEPPPAATKGKPAKTPEFKLGTCETACDHYLSCAKLRGDDQRNVCLYGCVASGANPYQLGVYNQLDCQRAVMIVLAAQLQAIQQAQGGNGNGGGGGNGKGSRCAGCVRDGNECIWLSQSNWGTGPNSPYSGAAASCDADCCQ